MKYNYEYEIKYQEVDGQKKLRLFNLENYLLEVAGTVADELGFGIQALHPMGITWILTRMSVEMYALPTHCEKIRIETWIESNVHMLSTRNFRIYSGDTLIGQCKSVWAVLDLEKREIVNCFDMPIFEGSVDGEVLEMGDGCKIECRYVPGHCPGSMAYVLHDEQMVLTGDALFQGSIGRTDLPGGSYPLLIEKLHSRIMVLPDEYQVLSGHGDLSTIGEERRYNGFLA